MSTSSTSEPDWKDWLVLIGGILLLLFILYWIYPYIFLLIYYLGYSIWVIFMSICSGMIGLVRGLLNPFGSATQGTCLCQERFNPGGIPKLGRGLLYPFESETREVRSLDGVWTFLKSNPDKPTEGITKQWFTKDLSGVGTTIVMSVPASYNDVTEDMSLRDHVGIVWYERKFFVDLSWKKDRLVWIRFGSVHYSAIVWINGKKVAEHSIGHLPFEAEISSSLNFGKENRITVLVGNVLTDTTIPQGSVQFMDTKSGKKKVQKYGFDFFNYSGIRRSVHLYTTPKQFYIEDIDIKTSFVGYTGMLTYTVFANSTDANKVHASIKVINKKGTVVGSKTAPVNKENQILIKNVIPWWPYLMHPDPGYLYTLEIRLSTPAKQNFDVYRMKFGFRTLSWSSTQFLINGKPIYFRGFGRLENSDIRGSDNVLLTKDINLLKWIGANAYRASHYPYSEESLQFSDENGIMIVEECSSVNTNGFTTALLENHKSALSQLIYRDRNHPSVVMWSVANYPRTSDLKVDDYLKEIVKFTKSIDPSRPVTALLAEGVYKDLAAQHMDIISFNINTYEYPGTIKEVSKIIITEANNWNKIHFKPVVVSDCGAETWERLYFSPADILFEEYQYDFLLELFKAFDHLRDQNFFIGEFICYFTDFNNEPNPTRVGENKKGIYTWSQLPKQFVQLVRKRYHDHAHNLEGSSIPSDIE